MLLSRPRQDGPGGHRSPGPRPVPAPDARPVGPRTLNRPARALAVLTVAVAGVAGCSSGPGPVAGDPATTTAPTPSVATPPIYAAVYGSAREQREIATAQQQLVVRCMADAGFSYRPPPVPAGAGQESRPRPFGLEDLPGGTEADAPDPAPTPASTGRRFQRALFGGKAQFTAHGAQLSVSRPATGCLAEAEQQLLGTARREWMTLRIVLYEAERAAEALVVENPSFRRLNAAWSACMARHGHRFGDPMKVPDLTADDDPELPPVARDDLTCKAETDYLGTAYALLADAQRRALADHPQAITRWRELLRRQHDLAVDQTGSTGSAGDPAVGGDPGAGGDR